MHIKKVFKWLAGFGGGIIILALLFIVYQQSTCGYQLEKAGLMGEHELVQVDQARGIQGSLNGDFFLASGSLNGIISSKSTLTFFWIPKQGSILLTELPMEKLTFIIDDTKEVPTVEFLFDQWWLKGPNIDKVFVDDFNSYVNGTRKEGFLTARIKISKTDFKQKISILSHVT